MAGIEIYAKRYDDEHGHPPAGRRFWIFQLVSKLGHATFLLTGEVLVYEKALEVAIQAAEKNKSVRIIVEP
ncbi:hypothetical protein JQ615_38635 [Bradyrhizobium jicamae]|uniref:Uncharacterized protein n=1 Tax=Bradyrhizobium jicamae TaxID=280332 RepID=A0ABS5FX21_9BRAD|nr:hypothetical protein [Bradyrhizobium jicamae]MBR0801281.1 hypothetical protein [Bradyrhizobium jicamae]MBR0938219.1 hypothetical protein [Bradyrhizobium jicamae]